MPSIRRERFEALKKAAPLSRRAAISEQTALAISSRRSVAIRLPTAATLIAAGRPLSSAIDDGLANTSSPTVIDVVVAHDPAQMLPGVDNRTLKVSKGDRPV